MNCFLDARSKIFYLEGLILAEQQHLAVTTGDRDPDIALQNETWHNEELRQQLLIAETALARLATKVADAEAMREQNLAHVARTRDQTAILADYKAWRKQRGAGAGGGGLGGKMQGLGRSEKGVGGGRGTKDNTPSRNSRNHQSRDRIGVGRGKQEDTISKQQKRTASTDDPSYHWIMRTGKPATNAEEPDSAAKKRFALLGKHYR